jgi:uncharacterized protein YgbK (DUF1537 family)
MLLARHTRPLRPVIISGSCSSTTSNGAPSLQNRVGYLSVRVEKYHSTCLPCSAANATRQSLHNMYQRKISCRNREETATYVGRVAYFVKAIVRDDKSQEALQALGLPTETQRFAIVDAYEVENVQSGAKSATMKQPWVSAVGRAMAAAKVLHSAAEYPRLLAKVQDMATVLACAYNSRITLKRPSRMAGSLKRLAIPVSSNFEQWYNREGAANHAVHPVCRIDPRKCTTVYGKVDGKAQSAVTAIRGTMLYFVHTYSSSNCVPARRAE